VSEQKHRDMFGASGFGDTSGFGGLAVRPSQLESTPKPYGQWFDEATGALEETLPDFGDVIERVVVHRGELTLFVKREAIADLCQLLRDDPRLRFEHFSGFGSRCRCPTPTRTCRASPVSIRAPTGMSARPTTSSASSSTGIPG
jgi:hypothetical protein